MNDASAVELRVEEGARVSEGQILAVLEDDEQRIAAERAKTAAEVASSELERQAGLLDQGLVSEDVYERLRRDAVDARHEHRGRAEVWVAREVGRSVLDAPQLRIGHVAGHADRGAAVAAAEGVVLDTFRNVCGRSCQQLISRSVVNRNRGSRLRPVAEGLLCQSGKRLLERQPVGPLHPEPIIRCRMSIPSFP